jgi:hypothetical protein
MRGINRPHNRSDGQLRRPSRSPFRVKPLAITDPPPMQTKLKALTTPRLVGLVGFLIKFFRTPVQTLTDGDPVQ